MYRDEVGTVLRLGDLKDEDGNRNNKERGGGGGWYNNDAVNGKKSNKEGQEEVGD